jgi:hypothetical protein
MPALDEVYDDGGGIVQYLRLGTALALVLVGATLLAAGTSGVLDAVFVGAGLSGTLAWRLALTASLLVPPGLFCAVLWTLDTGPAHHRLAAVSVGLAVVGALALGVVGPGPVTGGLYVLGVGELLVSVGWAAVAPSEGHPGADLGSPILLTHGAGGSREQVPADGGTDDEELQFPLEDEQ